MLLELRRIYLPDATVGVLTCAGHRFATLEDAGPGDVPNTCVYEGDYALVPHSGPKYPQTWALLSERVSHLPEAGKRSAILIHTGNTTRDTLGCILVGTSLVFSEARSAPALFNSRVAFARLIELLRSEPTHRLHVQKG
jgi:hypothetical protein